MIVAVGKETYPGERRVALIPAVVPQLTKASIHVLVESGAGLAAGYTDDQYVEKGAQVVGRPPGAVRADVVAYVRALGANREAGRADLEEMRGPGGHWHVRSARPARRLPGAGPAGRDACLRSNWFRGSRRRRAWTCCRRWRRSPVTRRCCSAANHLPKLFPMLMTAAGTLAAAGSSSLARAWRACRRSLRRAAWGPSCKVTTCARRQGTDRKPGGEIRRNGTRDVRSRGRRGLRQADG